MYIINRETFIISIFLKNTNMYDNRYISYDNIKCFEKEAINYCKNKNISLKIINERTPFKSVFFTFNEKKIHLNEKITKDDLYNYFRQKCPLEIMKLLLSYTKIKIIIPCFNEEENIFLLYKKIKNIIKKINNINYYIPILFVDDGSYDNSLDIIKSLIQDDSSISCIKLSRNFGKEAAMLAGIENSKDCDAVIFLDADGQDSPELIVEMIQQYELGYDDVYGKRISRKDKPFYKNYLAKCFYKVLQKTTSLNIPEDVGDFRLINKKCINAISELKEKNRYTKGLFAYIGFKKKILYFNRPERSLGKSKCGLGKQLKLAMTGLINFSSIFTVAPLILSSLSFILSIFIFLFNTNILLENSINSIKLLILISVLFITGFILLSLSIITKIQNNILNETKNRPIYYIEEKI